MFRVLTVLLLTLVTASAGAQSLGDLARKEEERRKAIAAPGKTYTNNNLRSEPAPTPAPSGAAPASGQQPAPPSPSLAQGQKPEQGADQKTAPVDETKTEAYWRQRMKETRDNLARAQILADALQSRINGLSTDYTNRDDPAQREMLSVDRQKAIAELDRVKKEITQYQKAIDDLQEEARRAGVPPGWLR